ncbi:stimulator of interferon genes protein-like [Protopterus annectens]|uniref:stimulator of interferon genes protein-like n=1 Tax=Protopterus annectens TaxID=7888 RepID=UPI001CFBF972|nr:stimulator of interferon genes protein-like [Protopterus annectens]
MNRVKISMKCCSLELTKLLCYFEMPLSYEFQTGHTTDIIPKTRGNWSVLEKVIIVIVVLLLSCIKTNGLQELGDSVALYFLAECIKATVNGICDFTEECRHLQARYHGSYLKALEACFGSVQKTAVLMIMSVFFYLLRKRENVPFLQVIRLCFCSMLYSVLGLHRLTPAEMSVICEKEKLNVAHGLAWSYYIGYLKIILPGWKKNIAKFNEKHNNLLKQKASQKLHVLIPLSGVIYDKLNEADNNIIFQENTPEISLDRGGVQRRTYKQSVYQILDEDKRPHYCILEYPAILRTLYDMSNDTSAQFSREQRLNETKLFYRTLQEIVDKSLEYREHVRLIIVNDIEKSDMQEKDPHFLSKEVLKHIKQGKKKNI